MPRNCLELVRCIGGAAEWMGLLTIGFDRAIDEAAMWRLRVRRIEAAVAIVIHGWAPCVGLWSQFRACSGQCDGESKESRYFGAGKTVQLNLEHRFLHSSGY